MLKRNESIALSAANPFSDSKASNYSDNRVVTEFCPVSKFWSLFNDQHEILVGTRGCGKTLLLKMMRYSMLNKLPDLKAKKLISEKKYIAFYVPLHLEYIKKLSNSNLSPDAKIAWFRFAFNCALAQSIIIEITEMLNDLYDDDMDRIKTEYALTKLLDQCWTIDYSSPVFQLSKLREKVVKLFYNTDPISEDLSNVPYTFNHSLGSSLSSISHIICEKLNISPTWIICVDEAEFIEENYQKCINTAFRSDTDRIALKVATLPFYHTTKSTLDEKINVMDGHDFKYTIVDMKYDEPDFINVTNSLVRTRFQNEDMNLEKVDDFLETVGSDNYIDYYSKEFGKEKSQRHYLEQEIFSQLSENSKDHNSTKTSRQIKKSVIDKLAPIFYLREMYKKTKKGHNIPGWYAGATMVRRIAQGNPRIFIRIMNDLYNAAKGEKLPLRVKAQHKIIMEFANSFCNETQTLEQSGPMAKKHLEYISEIIHKQTHNSTLRSCGVSFKLKDNTNLAQHKSWIERSVAFSRLMIDDKSLKTQITVDTIFQLAYVYAVSYWLPMRTHTSPLKIGIRDDVTSAYTIKRPKKGNTHSISGQLAIFNQGDTNYDY